MPLVHWGADAEFRCKSFKTRRRLNSGALADSSSFVLVAEAALSAVQHVQGNFVEAEDVANRVDAVTFVELLADENIFLEGSSAGLGACVSGTVFLVASDHLFFGSCVASIKIFISSSPFDIATHVNLEKVSLAAQEALSFLRSIDRNLHFQF